jgi:hypothetical protein
MRASTFPAPRTRSSVPPARAKLDNGKQSTVGDPSLRRNSRSVIVGGLLGPLGWHLVFLVSAVLGTGLNLRYQHLMSDTNLPIALELGITCPFAAVLLTLAVTGFGKLE